MVPRWKRGTEGALQNAFQARSRAKTLNKAHGCANVKAAHALLHLALRLLIFPVAVAEAGQYRRDGLRVVKTAGKNHLVVVLVAL